jgi:ParB family transcriptional regulator, chromosome partitioning protein
VVERGIGRGLAAILPSSSNEPEESLHEIPVDLIRPNPRQPRGSFDEQALRELSQSIEAHGLLQPVLVRPLTGAGYELIAGERRWRAARLAGIARIPALVRPSEDSQRLELALIENMAREDLNPVEAAQACAALVEELRLTKEEVGRRVGKSRAAISNLIRLLDLPQDVLAMVESGELSEGHGRALLQTRDTGAQRSLARRARDEGLSVRALEALTRDEGSSGSRGNGAAVTRIPADAEQAVRDVEDSIGAALGIEVRVRLTNRGGKLEIPFEDIAELHQLAQRLSPRLAA